MAQAYTSPDWASGEGISASNLQSISNALEGIVQGSDKAIHNIDINGSNLVATYVDGTTETFPVVGVKGIAEVTKSSSGNVDTYTIIYTDGTTYSFTVKNGGGGGSASEVSYNNAITQIEATNVQDAIDSVFTSVSNGKELVASAITDKGIPTLATDTFQTMADHIAEIEGGGAGGGQTYFKFYDPVGGTKVDTFTSTMNGTLKLVAVGYMNDFATIKINGNVITPSESYYITAHYYYYVYVETQINKNDVIEVSGTATGTSSFSILASIVGDGMDIADTTAIESDVAIGKIFHKANGTRAVGTLEAAKVKNGTVTLTTADQTIYCGFKPTQVCVCVGANRTTYFGFGINTNGTTVGSRLATSGSSSATSPVTITLTEDGFKVKALSSSYTLASTYYAIG